MTLNSNDSTLHANGHDIECLDGGDHNYQLRMYVFSDNERQKMLEVANQIALKETYVRALVTDDGQFWLASEFRADLHTDFGLDTAAQSAQRIADVYDRITKHIHPLN